MTRTSPAASSRSTFVKHLKINLSDALYHELKLAAADCGELDELDVCSPADFARECIESVLASRRLQRFERPRRRRSANLAIA